MTAVSAYILLEKYFSMFWEGFSKQVILIIYDLLLLKLDQA
jgi:hypothetical protein